MSDVWGGTESLLIGGGGVVDEVLCLLHIDIVVEVVCDKCSVSDVSSDVAVGATACDGSSHSCVGIVGHIQCS